MQPFQEGRRLRHQGFIHALWWIFAELLFDLQGLRPHIAPIRNGRANIVQNRAYPIFDSLQHIRVGLLINLNMHETFAREVFRFG